MNKLNFAIIGCGRISYKHVEGLYENKDLSRLVATCDVKLELAEAKAKEYKEKINDSSLKVEVYTDYKEMIEKTFGEGSCCVLNIRPAGGYAF